MSGRAGTPRYVERDGRVTIERAGAELRKDAFGKRVLQWYRLQTNRNAPNNTYFGRAVTE